MQISIFGLGYVGTVAAACLSEDGHHVIGVDPNPTKIDLINGGISPIIEAGLSELIKRAFESGSLRAVSDAVEAVQNSAVSFVCVGTPSQPNGDLDLTYIRNVCEGIGQALAVKRGYHVVVIRSTMLPGTMTDIVIPILERASGLVAGVGFGVCTNPEFLREGTAIFDYRNPPKTVIGASDEYSGDLVAALYESIDSNPIRTDLRTAEMVKYVDNSWHALKVGFANEIGAMCKALKIDSHAVMDIFCKDTKLNLSPYYLKPGFAFGGSCLPKDLRAINYRAKTLDVDLSILPAIMPSNRQQIERGLDLVIAKGKKKIGVLGFSFKAGTDDLRESPIVEVIERLLGKGYDLRVYDKNVSLARLVGANRDFILSHIPHIAKLMVEEIDAILSHAEVLVLGNGTPEFQTIAERVSPDQAIVDLVRLFPDGGKQLANYDGIGW